MPAGHISALVSITPSPLVPAIIKRLIAGESIPAAELTAAFDLVMSGEATPVQIAALLVGLRVKGETADEVAAVAPAGRKAQGEVRHATPPNPVGTLGTRGGGGGPLKNFSPPPRAPPRGPGPNAKHRGP